MRAAESARDEVGFTTDDWRELAEGALVILRAMRHWAPWWGRVAIGWVIEELDEWIVAHPRPAPDKGLPERYQLP